MKLMPDLEKVPIRGLCGGQKTSDVQPVINLLFNLNFKKIENLVPKGFCLWSFFFNYWILCHMQSCWF